MLDSIAAVWFNSSAWFFEGVNVRQFNLFEEGVMKAYATVVLIVVLMLAPCARADTKAQRLELKTEQATLVVKDHDGKPLAKAPVKLLDAEGKVVATLATDAEGKCQLKDIDAGKYKLVIAARATVSFSASDKAKVGRLLVMLPPPAEYAAGGEKKAFQMPALLTFIIGGVAVAAVTIAAVSGGGGGGGH
jgi:5-hydroxyisourate hydrolase-like protein (transthyretin family)